MIEVGIGNMNSREVLRECLTATKLSTNMLAQVLGMHRRTLTRYIFGEQPTPRHVALAAIAIAMNCGITVRFEKPFTQLAVAAKRARIT